MGEAGSPGKRFFDSVNVGLMAAMLGFSLWVWPDLPERIPTHFGIDGRPDAGAEPTVLSWFGLVIFAIIQLASYRTALGEDSQGAMILVLLLAVLSSPFLLVVFFLRFRVALEAGERLSAGVEAGADGARVP